MKEKALDFLKKNYIVVICAVCVIISLTALIIALSVGGGEGGKAADSQAEIRWGEGLTEGIPQFEGEAELRAGENSVAAFYRGVSGDMISQYEQRLESELSIEFGGTDYPKAAIFGERIITLHYNATEMEFSVTVVKNDN